MTEHLSAAQKDIMSGSTKGKLPKGGTRDPLLVRLASTFGVARRRVARGIARPTTRLARIGKFYPLISPGNSEDASNPFLRP